MACANDLLSNFQESCEPLIGGIEDRLYIVPFNSMSKEATLAFLQKTPEFILTNLVMKANKPIFYCIGKSSNVPSTTFSRTPNGHQTKHEVRFKVYKDDPATRANLERLKDGKFLIIVQFADGTFDVYGLYQGMFMTEMPFTPADGATNRVYSIAFASSETAQEPFGSVNLLKGTNAATKLYLESLVAADVDITPLLLPAPVRTVAYTETITQVGIIGVPVWSVSAGTLPTGLTLNVTTGVISGIATTAGSYSFTVAVTDGISNGSKSYTVIVA